MGAKSMMRTDRIEPARRSKEVDWGGKGKEKMITEPRKVQMGDNEGALALIKNRQVGARTKHIDIRHHFMRDKWEEGLLRVAHIPGEDNEADICTKNVTNRLHLKHRSRIRHGILWLSKLCNHPPIQREDVVISEEID